jgi:hypothetical protein
MAERLYLRRTYSAACNGKGQRLKEKMKKSTQIKMNSAPNYFDELSVEKLKYYAKRIKEQEEEERKKQNNQTEQIKIKEKL